MESSAGAQGYLKLPNLHDFSNMLIIKVLEAVLEFMDSEGEICAVFVK